MKRVLPLERIASYVGREYGKSEWLTIDQARIDAFAECTDDRQWIHVDARKAAHGPYGKTVAHGLLILSLIPHLSRNVSLIPEGVVMTVNYGIDKVRFLNPVPVDSRIRDTLVLKSCREKDAGHILLTIRHTIDIDGRTDPACLVEMLRMYVTTASVQHN